MSSILDLLSDASHDGGTIHLPDEGRRVTSAELWTRSDEAARWLRQRTEPGDTVAAVLVSTFDCLGFLLGAWKAGVHVASLPRPSRAMTAATYTTQSDRLIQAAEARLLFTDDTWFGHEPVVGHHQFGDTRTGGPALTLEASGGLIQCSSGSTGQPKGMRLAPEAIAANVVSIIEAMGPPERVAVCSWLPLSHDMGLIGMFLTAVASFGPRFAGRGDLVLTPPETFVANPATWLTLCSEHRATITAGPTFAYELTARRLESGSREMDLSALEVAIVGAEPVRASTLAAFAEQAGRYGFDGRALCPAYGLAEACLAVTMVRPGESWTTIDVDRSRLMDGDLLPASPDATATTVVPCGRPLEAMEVRIGDGSTTSTSAVGEIEVRGPSLFDGYLGDGGRRVDASGWFRTKDLGFLVGDQLAIVGRVDDVLFFAGRKVLATDLETLVGMVEGVRLDHCVAVPDESTGGYVVVAERQRGSRHKERMDATLNEIRLALVRSCGTAPRSVILVQPGSMPKTSSGKIQRHLVVSRVTTGELDIAAQKRFGAAAQR